MADFKYYFAYGSNMDEIQMTERSPDSVKVTAAVLRDYSFLINSRGVATIVPDEGSEVHGIIWTLDAGGEKELDRREGVAAGFYRKEFIEAVAPDGKAFNALAYVAADSEKGAPREGYLEKILRAAQDNNFPAAYIEKLRTADCDTVEH